MSNTATVKIDLEFDGDGGVKVLQQIGDESRKTGETGEEAFNKAGTSLGDLNGKASIGYASLVKMAGAAAGLYLVNAAFEAMVAITDEALDSFEGYESAITDMAKVTDASFAEMREEIEALPPELGTSTELMQGYYQVISAGVTDPKKALETITDAARAAQAAHVDQGEVVKGLTGIMEAYAGEVDTASEAADLLFAIESAGKTSVAELIPYIGELSSKSAALGVNQDELGAAFAQVTKLAGNTSVAATQYKAVMTSLMAPSKDLTDLLEDYGGAQKAIEDIGFAGVLKLIADEADGSAEKAQKLLGSSEALGGYLAISSKDFEGFTQNLETMGDKTGRLDTAFAEWQGTMGATKQIWESTVQMLLVELGEELAPVVNDAIRHFADLISENKEGILTFFSALGTALDIVVTATTFWTSALVTAAKFWPAYNAEIEKASGFTLALTAATENNTTKTKASTISNEQAVEALKYFEKKQKDATDSTEKQTDATKDVTDATKGMAAETEDTGKKVRDQYEATTKALDDEIDRMLALWEDEAELVQQKIDDKADATETFYKDMQWEADGYFDYMAEGYVDDSIAMENAGLSKEQAEAWLIAQIKSLEDEKNDYLADKYLEDYNAAVASGTDKETAYNDYKVAIGGLSDGLTRELEVDGEEQVADVKKSYEDMAAESESFFAGVSLGWQDLQDDQTTWGEHGYDVVTGFADDASGAFKTGFKDILTGDFDDLEGLWDSLWDSMADTLAESLADMVVNWAVGGISSYLTSGGLDTAYDWVTGLILAEGAYKVKEDSFAFLHAGEMVIPAALGEIMREGFADSDQAASMGLIDAFAGSPADIDPALSAGLSGMGGVYGGAAIGSLSALVQGASISDLAGLMTSSDLLASGGLSFGVNMANEAFGFTSTGAQAGQSAGLIAGMILGLGPVGALLGVVGGWIGQEIYESMYGTMYKYELDEYGYGMTGSGFGDGGGYTDPSSAGGYGSGIGDFGVAHEGGMIVQTGEGILSAEKGMPALDQLNRGGSLSGIPTKIIIPIKIVTPDGKIQQQQTIELTLNELMERSGAGEIVVRAAGVA